MTSMRAALLATALIAAPLTLAAQEPADTGWKAQVDLGLVNTAGNTSTTMLAAADEIVYTTLPWTFTQTFAVVYGRNDGVSTAENYRAKLRVDRSLSERVGVFARGGWERDEFAGINRRFEEDLGLGYDAVAAERTTLTLEAGAGAYPLRGLDREAAGEHRQAGQEQALDVVEQLEAPVDGGVERAVPRIDRAVG